MSKPIDQDAFWAGRLEEAKRMGDIRQTVFHTPSSSWEVIDAAHRKIAETLINPWDKVLDAGCGFGRAVEFLPGIYTGVDGSLTLIREACSRYPNHQFIHADLTDLFFEDNEFDWAVCISIQAMVIREKSYQAWDDIQTELLRVAGKILCLEYGNGDIGQLGAYTVVGKV